MSRIFSGDTFGLEKVKKSAVDNEDEDDDEEDDEDSNMLDRIPNIPTAHSRDAVDYSEIDEVVPDDPMFSEKNYRRGIGMVQQKNLPRSRLSLVTDNYDDDEEEEEQTQQLTIPDKPIKQEESAAFETLKPTEVPPVSEKKINIKEIFPGFEKGKILKFSELFMTNIKRPPKLTPQKRGKLV